MTYPQMRISELGPRHTVKEWWEHHSWQIKEGRWISLRLSYWDLGLRYFGWRPWRMLRASGFLPDLWYYLKCRFWKKYNTVTARQVAPTWTDRDHLMLHILFQCLCDVVEKEDWFNHGAYYVPVSEDNPYEYDQRDTFQEVALLYDWYVHGRPAREKAEAEALTRWHDDFMSRGGIKSVPSEHPGLSQLVFPEYSAEEKALHESYHAMEERGAAEDIAMMKRLCAIKNALWT